MESGLDTVYAYGWCLSAVSWVGKSFLNFIKNSEKYTVKRNHIVYLHIK